MFKHFFVLRDGFIRLCWSKALQAVNVNFRGFSITGILRYFYKFASNQRITIIGPRCHIMLNDLFFQQSVAIFKQDRRARMGDSPNVNAHNRV